MAASPPWSRGEGPRGLPASSSELGSITKQVLVVATVPGDPFWKAGLLAGKVGELGSSSLPAPKAAPDLLDSHSVSLPPHSPFWKDGLANLADKYVGVCCLATSRGIPRARSREKIRPADIHPKCPWSQELSLESLASALAP